MEGCLFYKRNSFLLTVAVVVFLAMTLSGTNANPEEDETAGEHINRLYFWTLVMQFKPWELTKN